MATKKPKKKASAKKAAPRKQITLVNERIILALESIADSLVKLSTPMVSIDPKTIAPAAATAAVADVATGDAAVHRAIVDSVSHLTDAELLS